MTKKPKVSALQKKINNPSSKLWRNKADKLWRELLIIEFNYQCALCGSKEYVQIHHLVPRQLSHYRQNLNNGVAVCSAHHKYSFIMSAHKNPVAFILIFRKLYPDKWKWLEETFGPGGVDLQKQKEVLPNYKEIYEGLLKIREAHQPSVSLSESGGVAQLEASSSTQGSP